MALFKHSRFLCCSTLSFGVSAVSPKHSLSLNIFSTSPIIFIKYWNRHHMTNMMICKVNINNTSVISFLIGNLPSPALVFFMAFSHMWVPFLCYLIFYSLTKLPRWYLRENLQEGFVMLVVVVIWPHWRFFDVIPYPFMSYCRVFTPIWYFQSSSSQSDLQHFHFSFSGLFILPRVLRFWVSDFYPQAFFLPYTPICDSGKQEQSIQDLPLYLPSQSCPFWLARGLELLMFEIQDQWLVDWASEPRNIK